MSHLKPDFLSIGILLFVFALTGTSPVEAKRAKKEKPPAAAKASRYPAPNRLKTPWGEEVTAENAWREYPRPQMERKEWLCLNGHWDYALVGSGEPWTGDRVENSLCDPFVKGTAKQPASWDGKILVPYAIESTLSGVQKLVRPTQTLWYKRSFEIPAQWKDRPVRINFGAVDWHAVVFVNGTQVGEHRGGYASFSFDITQALKAAGHQEIVVGVWDPTNIGGQSVGKQALPERVKGYRYEPTTGIWQTVWLEPLAERFIENLKIVPQKNLSSVSVNTHVKEADGLDVHIKVMKEGQVVAEKTASPNSNATIDIADARLWSPEDPFLYDLQVSLKRQGKELDQVESYFGMRTIGLKKDETGISRMTLNDQFIFQYGPLDQGYWPDSGLLPTTDEAAKFDVQYLKDISCNMVRVHMKAHPDRWYYWCDKIGLLVWQDFVCSRKFDVDITKDNAKQWEFEQREMVDTFHNHPSIVMWIVFNEGWGQYNTRALTEQYMAYDPSRIISSASGGTDVGAGHVYDNHDYGFFPSPGWAQQDKNRACLVGECGGFNMTVPKHTWYENTSPSNNDSSKGDKSRSTYADSPTWLPHYAQWIQAIRGLNYYGCPAAVYTQITDIEHELNGWMTYDRRVMKMPTEPLSEIHASLYRMPKVLNLVEEGSMVISTDNQDGTAWTKPEFDASAWKELPSPVLMPEFKDPISGPAAVRIEFDLDKAPQSPALRLIGLGGYEVHMNGELVLQAENASKIARGAKFENDPVFRLTGISIVNFPEEIQAKFKTGKNVLAIKYKGTKLYDIGVIDITD